MSIRTNTLCILLTLCLGALAATPRTLDLQTIVRLAVERSPLVEAETNAVAAETAKVEQSDMWQNPWLEFNAGRINTGGHAGSIWEGTLYQTFPFPGKLAAKRRAAGAQLMQVEVDKKVATLETAHLAYTLAYRLASLDQLVGHIKERRDQFALMRGYLTSRPLVSPIQRAEKALIENRLKFVEEHLVQMENQRFQAAEMLRSLTGEAGFIPGVPWWDKPELPDLAALSSKAETSSETTQRARASIARADAELSQARRFALPDLSVGLGYRREVPDLPTHFYTSYFRLTLPIWDHGQHLTDAARAVKSAEEARLTHHKRVLDAKLQSLAEEVRGAAKRVEIFPIAGIKPAHRAFEDAELEFRRGRLPITHFLEMETQLHEIQDRAYEAQAEFAHALSVLYQTAGLEPPLNTAEKPAQAEAKDAR